MTEVCQVDTVCDFSIDAASKVSLFKYNTLLISDIHFLDIHLPRLLTIYTNSRKMGRGGYNSPASKPDETPKPSN